MKVLIAGAGGQLGYELQRTAPADCEVVALGSHELDISDAEAVLQAMGRHLPQVVINSAAFTAVDKAESKKERVFAVNSIGAANVAKAAAGASARLIHISTDFVFDGQKSRPYRPEDPAHPVGVYGASKLEGEQAVRASLESTLIIRTAWLYSSHGSNFVKTMLRLMKERDQLGVVFDQVGSPTWARGLAEAVWGFVQGDAAGIYHWTDAGVASWYDFANAIQEEGRALGLLDREVPVKPLTTAQYPTPAARPAYSVLDSTATWDKLDCEPVHWRQNLRRMLHELRGPERG